MKIIDKVSQSSKVVYEDYLTAARNLGMPDSANPDEAVSCVIIGNKCSIEEIEIVSGFIAQQSAEVTRLRKAIEEADFHPEYCATVFKEPCDCGFEQWKRNALGENKQTEKDQHGNAKTDI